mgnify:CR=1 FL=1|jgi:hypothetical protein
MDERKRLEKEHGKVWSTKELQEDFKVTGFGYGLAVVTRKSDGQKGSLDFQHLPRFYFDFREYNG